MVVRSRNHCCREKAIIITYSVCVCVCVTLTIQNAKRTVSCLILFIFAIITQIARFREKFIKHKTRFLFSVQFISETFLNTRRIQRAIKSVYSSSCKVLAFLFEFNDSNFSRQFSKNSEIYKI